ncbi:hypothetical protein GCM10027299_53850 [Larkinella ripae]
MEQIQLSRKYFKNPVYAGLTLLLTVFIFEGINWSFSFEKTILKVREYGGILGYAYILFRGGIMPELATLTILIALLNIYHEVLRIKVVDASWSGILRYELLCLPVMLIAFFFFSPVTQTIRYLLVEFPAYDFSVYTETYLMGTYSLKYYAFYLIPVLLMGYSTITFSLVRDFIKGSKKQKSSPIIFDN